MTNDLEIKSLNYFRNFVSNSEANNLLHQIERSNRWTNLKHRRLQQHGGLPTPKGMIKELIQPWLSDLMEKVYNFVQKQTEVKALKVPNHVLINDYPKGAGIMAHKDGPLYTPVIMTVSLLSDSVIWLHKDSDPDRRFPVFLEKNSLVVFSDSFYTDYLHEIKDDQEEIIDSDLFLNGDQHEFSGSISVEKDRRISITIRNVPNAKNNPLARLKKR